jgi:CIC family chloride channel protein
MKKIGISLTHALDRFPSSKTINLGITTLLVGLLTAAGVWVFKWFYRLIGDNLFGSVHGWWVIGIPVVGGLLVGLLSTRWIGHEKVHGSAGVMQAVALAGGRIRYQKVPLKTAAAIISIGTGASVGPEDPSIQIGTGLGSMLGQILHLSDEHVRTLVAAGAASAIAAAFNAPIAGVFFSLEIVLGEIGGSAMGMILVASVASAVLTQAISGPSPAFQIPAYAFHSAWELPLYLLLGLVAGPVSAGYVRLLFVFQDLFGRWNISSYLKPAVAGLAVGVTGYFLPQVFGVGYETIGEVLNKNDLALGLLLVLMLAKLILTPVSIGGGFFGGVFAPSLYVGAMLGGAVGWIASFLFPALGISPAAFALVGMAAVLAGAVHAPLTSVILLFEMTGDYRIILPLMFAVAVSLLVAQRIQKDSVYTMGLARQGIRLDRGRDLEVMEAVTVGEAMCRKFDTVQENLSIEEATALLNRTKHHGLPVLDDNGNLIGILTLQDIEKAKGSTVGEICTREVQVAFQEETLGAALRRMSQRDVGRLPVVARDNPRRLVGLLRRSDVIHAYQVALTRRTAQRHREYEVKLDAMTPARVDVSDVGVETGSPAANRAVRDIPFPSDCVLASVRRGAEVFIPRGETILRAGDVLVVVAKGAARDEVFRLCRQEE